MVEVSGWGLQMTLGSGPQSRLLLRVATSGLLAWAARLGLANSSCFLV